MKAKKSILIVEDEAIIAMELESRVEELGYQCVGVSMNGPEALKIIERERPDLALLDIHIDGEMSGLDLAKKIRELHSVPFIFISAFNNEAAVRRAIDLQAVAFLDKPFLDDELQKAIQSALDA